MAVVTDRGHGLVLIFYIKILLGSRGMTHILTLFWTNANQSVNMSSHAGVLRACIRVFIFFPFFLPIDFTVFYREELSDAGRGGYF